jgi:hypothetical protein
MQENLIESPRTGMREERGVNLSLLASMGAMARARRRRPTRNTSVPSRRLPCAVFDASLARRPSPRGVRRSGIGHSATRSIEAVAPVEVVYNCDDADLLEDIAELILDAFDGDVGSGDEVGLTVDGVPSLAAIRAAARDEGVADRVAYRAAQGETYSGVNLQAAEAEEIRAYWAAKGVKTWCH